MPLDVNSNSVLRFIRGCVCFCAIYMSHVHLRAETLRAEKSVRYRTPTT